MAVNAAPDEPPAAAPSRLRRLIRPLLWLSAARGVAAVLVVTAVVTMFFILLPDPIVGSAEAAAAALFAR